MTVEVRKIELWCDSFHEGTWAAEGILRQWAKAVVTRTHGLGFIPQYSVQLGQVRLELQVFGGYENWTGLPPKIRELLDWGKPDIVGYDRSTDTVLFAVEETAAVPTGNQALQRCERMHGAGTMKVPFWYLLSQFGTHIDEGTRQASPWPALMAIALTATFRTPNIVLLYSSEASPEDYTAGEGMVQLFRMLAKMLENYSTKEKLLAGLDEELNEQFASMLRFVGNTYPNVTDFLPNAEVLSEPDTASRLAGIASGSDGDKTAFPMLDWPSFKDLPEAFRKSQAPASFIKTDSFLFRMEAGRGTGHAYTLSHNSGSRPQPEAALRLWIDEQHRLHASAQRLTPPADLTLRIEDFPESKSGLRHVTTAKNILYIVDSVDFVFDSLTQVFPRLTGKLPALSERAAIVYVSNSVKPGRIFGDPYTGQFAAFSWIFGGPADAPRVRIAYFPHHSHGVLKPERTSRNKGQLLFLSRADYLVFQSGAMYSVKEKRWL
jgi:hypothetical protein